MSRSEFRWNKKRKHYSYLLKDVGTKRKNILISSKPKMIEKKNKRRQRITINIPLFHHPDILKEGVFFIIPIIYLDENDSFDNKICKWTFYKNDKRKIKRLKKQKNRLRHPLR